MLFKEKKLSTNIKGFIVISTLLFILLAIYFLCNYNRFGVYKFTFNSELFASNDGIAYFTPKQKAISLYNIKYIGEEELFIKSAEISLRYIKDDNIKEISNTSIDLNDEVININDYLNTVFMSWEESKTDRLDSSVELFFKDNMYINIKIINSTNEEKSYNIKIDANRFANNKLFY